LILYSTPPITFTYLIKRLKNASNAKTYLLLKDIFPQNAVDLNLLKNGGFLHNYFRKKEKVLYEISDFIGCMSPANLEYIIKNNPQIEKNKLEVNPNSIEVKEQSFGSRIEIYNKYKIPRDKIIFTFGGNLGMPQGIEYLKNNIDYCKSIKEAFFLIVGNGTQFNNFQKWIRNENIQNALLIKELPKNEYDKIISLSHVGLIFLNPQFTIPNFPSRILSYMQNRMPVICATDLITDIGEIAVENKFGYSCLTSDLASFYKYVVKLLNNELRIKMGENALNFLMENYNIQGTYNKIIDKINL
jgi:glycosyltransferase involved in cell wall biosynthesis